MRYLMKAVFLVFLLDITAASAFSQLWNISDYLHDRINIDQTYFILHDTDTAEFAWASEWTNDTVQNNENRSAMFLWHFKDGTLAYSLQQQFIGDIGKNAGFLVTAQSQHLEDIHRNQIQPLSRNNYPVKVELWIGQVGDSTGFSPEFLGEAVCLSAQSIGLDRKYHFSSCQP
jgi:hypothetical protein